MSEDRNLNDEVRGDQEVNSNETPETQNQDQAQQTSAGTGSTDLIANVDVPYLTGDQDADGNEYYGLARGGDHFQTSEDDARDLVASGKAYYAKQNEDGNYVVDEEANQEVAAEEARAADAAAAEEVVVRPKFNSAVGMLGRDANESNNMTEEDGELTGRFVDGGNAAREQRLHEQSGVTRTV